MYKCIGRIWIYWWLHFNGGNLIVGGDFGGITRQKNWYNVTFPAGASCASFDIPIIDDSKSEDNETIEIAIMEVSLPFYVEVSHPNKSEITIVDNDSE